MIDRDEVDEHRFVQPAEAGSLLSGPVGRRVLAAAERKHCVYRGRAARQGRPRPKLTSRRGRIGRRLSWRIAAEAMWLVPLLRFR